MNTPINGQKIANQLAARLSLRTPQRESLDILVDLLEQLNLSQDPDLQHWLTVIQQQHPSVKDFERTFPSLCFALATGVGKTRLMGAMIAWLYLTGRSRHFFVLAPNLTIYEKLKQDFTLGHAEICVCRYSRNRANAAGHYYRRRLRKRTRCAAGLCRTDDINRRSVRL